MKLLVLLLLPMAISASEHREVWDTFFLKYLILSLQLFKFKFKKEKTVCTL